MTIVRIDEKYKKRLQEIIEEFESDPDNYTEESAHIDADNIICDLLKDLGYEDIVKIYNKIPKWYS